MRFNYHTVDAVTTNIFLQNQTVVSGYQSHNAMNKIDAGYNVTNSIPYGNYVVQGDANITLHAGNVINMKPNVVITPNVNGAFHAYVDPFFTCTQYPNGIIANDGNDFPAVIRNYEVEKVSDEFEETGLNLKSGFSLRNYPNPFSESTTIEYQISTSELVTISIHDNCGRPLFQLKNNSSHEEGIYKIELSGIQLAPGAYFCTLQTEKASETIELLVIK